MNFLVCRRRAAVGVAAALALTWLLAGAEPVFGQWDRVFSENISSGRLKEAEQIARQELARASEEQNQAEVQAWLNNLALVLRIRGQTREAESVARRALSLGEQIYGPDADLTLNPADTLATVLMLQGRYAEAEPLYRGALTGRERLFGPEHLKTVTSLTGLGECYFVRGQYSQAEPLLKQAVERAEALARRYRSPGEIAAKTGLFGALIDLANLYMKVGRLNEAERLCRHAVDLTQQAFGANHPDLVVVLNNLASVQKLQGRYSEAGQLFERVIELGRKTFGATDQRVLQAMNNLGDLYRCQHRYDEALGLLEETLRLAEKGYDRDHNDVTIYLENLGLVFWSLRQYDRAEPLYRRSLAMSTRLHGEDNAITAELLVHLGYVQLVQGQLDDAAQTVEKGLRILEKGLGPDHSQVAEALRVLSRVYTRQNRGEKALPLLDRSIAIMDRSAMGAQSRFYHYKNRADLRWRMGRHDEALDDLRHAIDLAEQVRGTVSEEARHQAESFTEYAHAFEEMVSWQAERNNLVEAFAAIQRFHARALLDEMRLAGADPLAGRPAAERERLQQREAALETRAAELEARLDAATKEKSTQTAALAGELAAARRELQAHEAEVRKTSPVVRDLLERQVKQPTLDDFRQRLLEPGDLLLVYLVGEDGGYVFAVNASTAAFSRLSLSDEQAQALNTTSGPLTAERLRRALLGAKPAGVVPRLADPNAQDAAPALAALWLALVPESQRNALVDGTVKRLIVETDGPLALLPFEALVVEPGDAPKYLLDLGPPVLYGPSATILLNLSDRPAVPPAEGREPVLALGDPAYPQAGRPAPETSAELPARSRYSMAGGALARLPFSGWEAQWVAKAFNDQGLKAGVFTGDAATERAVRYWAPGRKLLHLACHGLADQKFETLFAALAVAPGPRGALDPSDDGFLTLAEIYGLDLKACELAILSACQSNFGPQQQGEGTWAVSRGFLVAGVRRVVASNWLVDDEAAASLVSVFCTGLAREEKGGGTPNYAQLLQAAKRWVRQQDKWKAPYYWASLVLVGPS